MKANIKTLLILHNMGVRMYFKWKAKLEER